MANNEFCDVVEPSKIKRMQELLDESYAKGFADGKEEGLRVARQDRFTGMKGYIFGIGNIEQMVLPYDMEYNTLSINKDVFEHILHMISDQDRPQGHWEIYQDSNSNLLL